MVYQSLVGWLLVVVARLVLVSKLLLLIIPTVTRRLIQFTIVQVLLSIWLGVLRLILVCLLRIGSTFALGKAVEMILINARRALVLFHERVSEYLIIDNTILIQRVCSRHNFYVIFLALTDIVGDISATIGIWITARFWNLREVWRSRCNYKCSWVLSKSVDVRSLIFLDGRWACSQIIRPRLISIVAHLFLYRPIIGCLLLKTMVVEW